MTSLSHLAGRTVVESKLLSVLLQYSLNTVNSEIFTRVLFSRNFPYAKFPENTILGYGKITLSISDIGKPYIITKFFNLKFVL